MPVMYVYNIKCSSRYVKKKKKKREIIVISNLTYYIQTIISAKWDILHPFICTKSAKSGVHFTLVAHRSLNLHVSSSKSHLWPVTAPVARTDPRGHILIH